MLCVENTRFHRDRNVKDAGCAHDIRNKNDIDNNVLRCLRMRWKEKG